MSFIERGKGGGREREGGAGDREGGGGDKGPGREREKVREQRSKQTKPFAWKCQRVDVKGWHAFSLPTGYLEAKKAVPDLPGSIENISTGTGPDSSVKNVWT